MLLMIDNYDSFTYNLVQYFGELGQNVSVYRNDEITVDEIENLKPKHVVISPGPCTPNEAGISLELIEKLAGKIPYGCRGVCGGVGLAWWAPCAAGNIYIDRQNRSCWPIFTDFHCF